MKSLFQELFFLNRLRLNGQNGIYKLLHSYKPVVLIVFCYLSCSCKKKKSVPKNISQAHENRLESLKQGPTSQFSVPVINKPSKLLEEFVWVSGIWWIRVHVSGKQRSTL